MALSLNCRKRSQHKPGTLILHPRAKKTPELAADLHPIAQAVRDIHNVHTAARTLGE